MGVLIGGIIGLIIVGIVHLVRQSNAKKHADGMQRVLTETGPKARQALDRRLPRFSALMSDIDVERQSERLAALAALGEPDTIEGEVQAFTGSAIHLATIRAVGRLALAVHGRAPEAQLAAMEADHQALTAAGTNRLTLRALAAWLPVARAVVSQNTIASADRAEILKFQANPVVRRLLDDAFARAAKGGS